MHVMQDVLNCTAFLMGLKNETATSFQKLKSNYNPRKENNYNSQQDLTLNISYHIHMDIDYPLNAVQLNGSMEKLPW